MLAIDVFDPNNIPDLACEAMAASWMWDSGCVEDNEWIAILNVVLDAQPSGWDAIVDAVREKLFELSIENDWSDLLIGS